MPTLRRILVLLASTALACGPAEPAQTAVNAADPSAPGDAATEDAPAELPGGWKRFHYDDKASVLTPAQPEVVEDTDGTAYLASVDDVGFFIACDDIPNAGGVAVKDLLAQAKATRLSGRVTLGEREVSRDGMQGVAFETKTTAEGVELMEHDLLMIRGARGCFLSVLAIPGTDVTADKARYFDSLRMSP